MRYAALLVAFGIASCDKPNTETTYTGVTPEVTTPTTDSGTLDTLVDTGTTDTGKTSWPGHDIAILGEEGDVDFVDGYVPLDFVPDTSQGTVLASGERISVYERDGEFLVGGYNWKLTSVGKDGTGPLVAQEGSLVLDKVELVDNRYVGTGRFLLDQRAVYVCGKDGKQDGILLGEWFDGPFQTTRHSYMPGFDEHLNPDPSAPRDNTVEQAAKGEEMALVVDDELHAVYLSEANGELRDQLILVGKHELYEAVSAGKAVLSDPVPRFDDCKP